MQQISLVDDVLLDNAAYHGGHVSAIGNVTVLLSGETMLHRGTGSFGGALWIAGASCSVDAGVRISNNYATMGGGAFAGPNTMNVLGYGIDAKDNNTATYGENFATLPISAALHCPMSVDPTSSNFSIGVQVQDGYGNNVQGKSQV